MAENPEVARPPYEPPIARAPVSVESCSCECDEAVGGGAGAGGKRQASTKTDESSPGK